MLESIDIYGVAILLIVSFLAGALNTVAGGGSLLTLPVLIFLGLPSPLANATNRVAIFFQSAFSIAGFKSKGIFMFKYSFGLAIVSALGALVGVKIALKIDEDTLNKVIAAVLVFALFFTLKKIKRNKGKKAKKEIKKNNFLTYIAFFAIGIYGGFIQAGIGFVILFVLSGWKGLKLAQANSIKVFITLFFTSIALIIFILEDKVVWQYGLVMMVGTSIGAWLTSRWSVEKGEKYITPVLIVAVLIMAVKLWFF